MIDDEPDIGNLIVRVASQCGYESVATVSADEFRGYVKNWQPSHIVIDLSMPDADGIELLRFLATEKCAAHVIIASGFESKIIDSARQLGLERGLRVSGTLRKPLRLDTVREILNKLKGEEAWLNETALKEAIDDHAFSVLYQPKARIASEPSAPRLWSGIEGFEALIRWNHPKHGFVSPEEFVPLAESVGLIDQLTESVFTVALEQLKAWRSEGAAISVSLNVSAEDLYDVELVDILAERCRKAGVPTAQISLELTETAAMGNVALAMDILTRMRIKGFKLSMDDFGTGYSSLVQLQRLPFSELKIDKEFVRHCAVSGQSRIMVKTMVDLAHNLGLQVVGEGVEDEETLRVLAELDCDTAQGYFIGRPMPPDEVLGWLRING